MHKDWDLPPTQSRNTGLTDPFPELISMTRSNPDPATFNPSRRAAIDWIHQQVAAGFKPVWFVSAHFRRPTETGTHRDGSTDLSDRAMRLYKWNCHRRNDVDLVSGEAVAVSHKLQRYLWSSRPLSRTERNRNLVPTLIVAERGEDTHHLHLLLPAPLDIPNTAIAMMDFWRGTLLKKCHCLSRIRDGVDIRPIYDLPGDIIYVTKDVTATNHAIDFKASTLSAPPPSLKPPRRPRSNRCGSRNPRPEIQWPPQTVQHFKARRH